MIPGVGPAEHGDAESGRGGVDDTATMDIQTPKYAGGTPIVNLTASFKSGSVTKLPKVAMTAAQLHQHNNHINSRSSGNSAHTTTAPPDAGILRSPQKRQNPAESYYLVHDNSMGNGFRTSRSTASSIGGDSLVSSNFGGHAAAHDNRPANISPHGPSLTVVPMVPSVLSLGHSPERPTSPGGRLSPQQTPPQTPGSQQRYITGYSASSVPSVASGVASAGRKPSTPSVSGQYRRTGDTYSDVPSYGRHYAR
jgi:hypothetical protein